MKEIIYLSTFFLVIYILIFIIFMYRRDKRRAREFDRRRYTFELCSEKMQYICKYFADLSNRDNVILLFNLFECLSVGVYSDVLSKEVVKLCCGAYMEKFYDCNRYMLFRIRNDKDNSTLYANYEKLMEEQRLNDFINKLGEKK